MKALSVCAKSTKHNVEHGLKDMASGVLLHAQIVEFEGLNIVPFVQCMLASAATVAPKTKVNFVKSETTPPYSGYSAHYAVTVAGCAYVHV